jgi:hypothetical protein
MKSISLFWGYLIGEEHLTNEQFARIDFGNPALDTEFITFDPLASSFFQGKFYTMTERRFAFPHRTLPSMRAETMIIYEDTSIKIINPPTDLNVPAGILLCIFTGKSNHIKRAMNFVGERINLKFSPCNIDLMKIYQMLCKTRLKVFPQTLSINDLRIDDTLAGDLEVHIKDHDIFLENLKTYKPKINLIKLIIKEVSFQTGVTIYLNGTIVFDLDIVNLNLLETIYDVASRCVYTGNI